MTKAPAIDLAWHDACSASRAFTAEEKAAGWPDSMTPQQLACLQRPFVLGDKQGRAANRALAGALQAACTAGELAHTVETRREEFDPTLFEPIGQALAPTDRADWTGWGRTRDW